MADDDDQVIGVTIDRAAQLVGVSVRQLARWETLGLVRPQAHKQIAGRHVRIYGLHDLVEARIVAELLDRNVSVDQVREVVEFHRRCLLVAHPLRELVWAVDGGHVYVRHRDGGWTGGRHPGQGVISEVIDLEHIRAELRARVTERPPEAVGRIERRPHTHRKAPVLAGTRTPVAAVKAYLDRGLDDDVILEAFPHLTVADINAVRNAA